jgi:stage V sporulation protein T
MSNGIVRRIDDLGRIVIPKEIRRAFKIKEGDPMEVFAARNGSIIIKPYRKSWEECALEWFDNHASLMESHTISFIHSGDHTICTVWDEQHHRCWVGKAKRHVSDEYDDRIGKVAAYAHAMCIPVDDLIGYED